MKETDFYHAFAKSLMNHAAEFHGTGNWEPARFGERQGSGQVITDRILMPINRFLRRLGYRISPLGSGSPAFDNMIGPYGEGLANTYNLLADEYSQSVLIEVLAYRLLGFRRVKLWTNTPAYWEARSLAGSLPTQGRSIFAGANTRRLFRTDLSSIGYPITVFTHPLDITYQFLFNHYAYEHTNPSIGVLDGDYVIDGGASWGETALRFAHDAGETGRVFSFEFEPRSLEILKMNLALNAGLASRITVVEKGLWKDSSTILNFASTGPSTTVRKKPAQRQDEEAFSISIDDFASTLPRIDFIKLDVEGAELSTLHGAEKTIRKYRPKLAISVYHNLSDFVDIPAYLSSLELGYRFYLDHVTIYGEETTLFAYSE